MNLRICCSVVNQSSFKSVCGFIPDDFSLNKNNKNHKSKKDLLYSQSHRFNIFRAKMKTKKFELKNSTRLCIEKAIKEAQEICLDDTKTSTECISAWDKVEELSKAAADYQNKLISICDLQTFMFDIDPMCIDFLD